MADDDFLASLEKEAADVSSIPSDAGLSRLRIAAQRMVEQRQRVEDLKEQLRVANIELYETETRTLPDLFAEIGTDRIGLPEAGVDVVVKPHVHANIKADWPEEQREAGYAHLEAVGGGDLVRNEVVVIFPRGHFDELQEWMDRVSKLNLPFDPPDMGVQKTVPWNTLTAFVKEQIKRGTVLDLEKLGATVGSVASIQKRSS